MGGRRRPVFYEPLAQVSYKQNKLEDLIENDMPDSRLKMPVALNDLF